MADAMPDYEFERLKLERQRKNISITMLDQEIQNEELTTERKLRLKELKEVEATIGEPIEMVDLASKKLELERRRAELTAQDIKVRVAEIDGTIERHNVNIESSGRAIDDLDKQIASMKGGESG